MSDDKKPDFPMTNPVGWIFHASLMLLVAAIALNLAVAFLCPILPWLIGGAALVATTWIVIVVMRWRQSRW
jgi:uncharacterized membrane protein